MVELTSNVPNRGSSQVAPLSTARPRIIAWLFIVLIRFIYKSVGFRDEPNAKLARDQSSKLDEIKTRLQAVWLDKNTHKFPYKEITQHEDQIDPKESWWVPKFGHETPLNDFFTLFLIATYHFEFVEMLDNIASYFHVDPRILKSCSFAYLYLSNICQRA